MRKIYLFVFIISVLLGSCQNDAKPSLDEIQQDTTINEATSFNNLFLDSIHIVNFIAENPQFAENELDILSFYKQRNFEFAWFDSTGIGEQSKNYIGLLNNYILTEKDSSLYDAKLVDIEKNLESQSSISPQEKQNAELYFTASFFQSMKKIFEGKNIDASQLGWFIPKKKLNMIDLLDSTLKGDSQIDVSRFMSPQFLALKKALIVLQQAKTDHLDREIPFSASNIQQGMESKEIPFIRKKLIAFQDITNNDTSEDSTDYFDQTLSDGLSSFQDRMGLNANGKLTKNTISLLNIPIDSLIRRVLVNMERARWLPAQMPENYAWVNIPEFKLRVYEGQDPVLKMPVIVGSAAHNTVIFSGNLKYIVFAPYWNVPYSIVKNEVAPGIARNDSYISSHNMEIYGKYSDGLPRVRQKPGPNNSLGLVKFLFPNDYDIYFHDTPNHDLFQNTKRGLSHGCIRLSDPEAFANYLLRNNENYPAEKIDSLMHDNSKETWVSVKPPLPVYLVYFTSWVDETGKLNFRSDIYKHDKKLADKLFN